MNRYLLRFYKKGNMRFLSHLDLYRLFRRAVNRAGIEIDFSHGFNPHEKVNIVQPLSLGFESEAEFFEIDTVLPHEPAALMEELNRSLPDGIRFDRAAEIERRSKNLTGLVSRSAYSARMPFQGSAPDAEAFLAQDRVIMLRREKKTGNMVERDVKALISRFSCEKTDGELRFEMLLSSSSNAIVNPLNLIEAFLKWAGAPYVREEIRITRTAMYISQNGEEKDLSSL